MARKKLRDDVESAVLLKSRRRCCLCFWQDGIDEVQRGQIAHLDRDNRNSAEANLCFLCLKHHDQYDSKTSQSKGLAEKEVITWRDELYREMRYRYREGSEDRRMQKVFDYLEETMPDLLMALRADLKKHPLWRNIAYTPAKCETTGPRLLVYKNTEFSELPAKMAVLANHGLAIEDEGGIYRMTEAFVTYLRTS